MKRHRKKRNGSRYSFEKNCGVPSLSLYLVSLKQIQKNGDLDCSETAVKFKKI